LRNCSRSCCRSCAKEDLSMNIYFFRSIILVVLAFLDTFLLLCN
jgi:hypothetical protein